MFKFIPKFKWKSIIAGILTISLIFGLYEIFFTSSASDTASSMRESTISVGSIINSIAVSGSAELVDEQSLRFNQSGTVTAVRFSSGQEVKKGDVIAELDKTELNNKIEQAELSLKNSQITLRNLLDGNSDKEILSAKNTVTETQSKISVAEKNLEITKSEYSQKLSDLANELSLAKEEVANKETDLATANTNYNNTLIYENENMSSSENNYNATLVNGISEARNVTNTIQNNLNTVNKIIGIDGTYENVNYDGLSARNPSAEINTKTYYYQAKKSLATLEAAYKTISANATITKEEVVSLLTVTMDALKATSSMADGFYDVMDSSTSTTSFSQETIDTNRSAASSMKSSADSSIGSLQSIIANVKNLEALTTTGLSSNESIQSKKNAVTSAEYNLRQAKNNLQSLEDSYETSKENAKLSVTSSENDLQSLKNTLATAKENLKDLEDGADEDDIAKARNEVINQEISLEQTKTNEEDYEIIAPFDGIIRDIDYKIGDNILSDDDKYVYIENPDLLEVTVALDQIDIVSVEVGQEAKIIFDAYTDKTFIGQISEINQSPTTTSGVVSYTVKISLDKGETKIYSGMTAEVEIVLSKIEDALLVPSSAITKETDGTTTVLVKESDGTTTKTEIETGITDGTNTEVLNGLKEGDVVLETVVAVEASSGSTSVSMGGGGGDMGGPPM